MLWGPDLGDASAARQLALEVPGEPSDPRWEHLDRVADAVSERFDGIAVSYASLLDEDAGPEAPDHEDHR